MRTEIKFKRINVNWSAAGWWDAVIRGKRNPAITFCDDPDGGRNGDGMSKYVEVPRTVDTIYLVFTDRPGKDRFKIIPDRRNRWLARLEGVSQYILEDFAQLLRQQLENGARYVHIEYDA